MTVRELIAALSRLDGNMPVFVAGYESGLDVATRLELVTIGKFDPSAPRYEGAYEEKDELFYGPWELGHYGDNSMNEPDASAQDGSTFCEGVKLVA